MNKIITLKGLSVAKRLTFTALFAALCCVSTVLITVPLPGSGYLNTGDVFVLLSAWCLGPIYGVVAAGVGSALGDLVLGYAIYAPATLLIKSASAFLSYAVYALLKRCVQKRKWDTFLRLPAAVLGELVMIVGYFLYESILYGVFGAIPNLLGNGLQAVGCTVCALVIITALYNVKSVRNLFPPLQLQPQNSTKQDNENV